MKDTYTAYIKQPDMKAVYIISRYRADTRNELAFNEDVARFFARKVMLKGNFPIVPHLYIPQFLNDNQETERNYGLELGKQLLKGCDEFLLVVVDGVISEGMAGELKLLKKLDIPGHIVFITKKDLMNEMKAAV